MPEPAEGSAAARQALLEMTDRWRITLGDIKDEARAGRPSVELALADATSADAFDDLATVLSRAARRASRASTAIEELTAAVGRLRSDWAAEWRHNPAEVKALADSLAARASEDPPGAARRWLAELLDALDARRWDVVDILAAEDIQWPPELDGAVGSVREGLRNWQDNDFERARETVAALGRAELPGLESILTDALRSRAHRLAAWISLRRLNQPSRALEHLNEAVSLYSRGGRMHGERAAYFIFVGELEQAAADAQHAIELALDNPAGYLELGVWAELTGDWSGADESYRGGLELMTAFEIARLHRRASMLDPPGRLLLAAAERLLELGRPAWSLDLCDRALSIGVRGAESHPEADAYRVRSVAAQRAGRPAREVATAAMNSGRLYLWNGDLERAVTQLERAVEVDDSLHEAGWILADALLSTSLPLGENLPHHGSVSGARDAWEEWRRRVGPPRRDTSWAYLTRAIVSDLMTQRPGTDRGAGIWEAIAYVERAIVYDDADALRWGYAARYLRYARLDELAFEAVNRGYELSAGDREVLAERLPMLASRGMLDQVEEGADRLYKMFGPDPWVGAALAWVAMHRGGYGDAIEMLEMPIAEGNDPAWYYDMRALCHLALDDVEAAVDDYRTLRETAPAIDGTTKSRLAIADIITGDTKGARACLRQAKEDTTGDRTVYLGAAALAALADDDLARANSVLEEAIAGARSVLEAEDVVGETRLRATVVGDGRLKDERERLLDRLETEAVPKRREALEANPPTADSELEWALGEHDRGGTGPDLDEAETALLAVASRRHVRNGRLADAIAGYERLRESTFEPEATLALVDVLRRLSRIGARQGDVDAVRSSCSRLQELDATTSVRGALAVAEAMRAAGRMEEARDHVEEHAGDATSDAERIEVERRLGALHAELGDLAAGARHFGEALSIAQGGDDHAVAGQVELRLAVLAFLGGDLPGARQHLDAAMGQWERAGAFDPAAALLEEARNLRRRAKREGHWTGIAGEALDWIDAALAEQTEREHQPA
jgi:tetratricopeptide (TPR) repeat protein